MQTCNNELDSHADTCCFGKYSLVIAKDLSQEASVTGFLPELGQVDTAIASVAVAYDDETSYTTFVLIFHQVLYFPNLEHNLICPAQLRANDIIINDVPISMLTKYIKIENISAKEHSIICHSPPLQIPLFMRGVMSCFKSRACTLYEYEHPEEFPQVVMTYDSPVWDPYDEMFNKAETNLRSVVGYLDEDVIQNVFKIATVDVTLRQISVVFTSEFQMAVDATHTIKRKGTVSPEDLARRWRIGLDQARRTIERTTQLGVRDFTTIQGTRRLRHTNQQFKYRRLNAVVYTDTMFMKPMTLLRHTCAQVYVTDFEWTKVYPIKSKKEAPYTLDLLHKEYGVFHTIVSDNAPELIHGDFARKARKAGAILHPIEAHTPNQNRAESAIRELKRLCRRAMVATASPAVLWDHCFQLYAEIRSHTAMNLMNLYGDVPHTVLVGDTADISHLCQFAWYDPVWYIDIKDPLENKKIARYLGPSHYVGDRMASKILAPTGRVLVRSSVFPITPEESILPSVQEKVKEYSEQLKNALGERIKAMTMEPEDKEDEDIITPDFEPYQDETQVDISMPEADDMDDETFDKFISARVMLPGPDGLLQKATVKRRKCDDDGNYLGVAKKNPLLSTAVYDVDFEDGTSGAYAANIIAENIFQQVDDEGREHLLLDHILDHYEDKRISAKPHDKCLNRRTTKGWKFTVQWRDGSTSWVPLKDLKESNPVETAEYVKAHNLQDKPAFSWWVPFTLKKRDRIIKAIKQTKYQRTDQKFGIEIPKTVKRALEIDQETGTTFWRDALMKEMKNIHPVMRFLELGEQAPVGYQRIPCHIIFDVKMDFTRKARFVAGGHKTEPPQSITYASVVSRDSVRIAFLIAALNDLDILAADIQGAYLNAPCLEKVYTVCGPEFGNMAGRVAVITKALYGLRSSGYAWRTHLADTLRKMGFQMCLADNDVWLRRNEKEDKSSYYEYVLVYTDDILAMSCNPALILNSLDQHYVLKPGSIGKPTQYLGAQIGEFRIPDEPEKIRWSMSSEKYVKEAIRNVSNWLEEHNLPPLKSKAPSVLPSTYRPELDVSEFCSAELAHYYQQQIGVLRWAVELGRINICAEVSMLASYATAPRVGHFNAMLHIFAFLHHHPRCRLVFDDSYVNIQDGPDRDWHDFYPDAEEQVPDNVPEPLGNSVEMIAFVDSDHAGDLVTRRSRTGILIYLNRAPIYWYSKKQTTIETSTFGSEFMALKTATDIIKGLRYKIRMMGIPLDGPTHVRVDNASVVNNATLPESVLQKKSNSIAYHFVRENVAAKVIKVGYETSESNLADMLTKIQSGPTRTRLANQVLF